MAVPGKNASQKFSSTLSQGGAEDFDIFCEQCDRDDIRLPAYGYCVDCEEHLCQACFNTHRRPKPLRHHHLLDKNHMPQTQNTQKLSDSTTDGQAGDLTKPCPKHTKEVIKYYCHDHQALICSVCVTLEHTPTSCHVDYIPDISGQIIDSNEFNTTLKDIDLLTDKCYQMTKDLKDRVAKSTTSLKDAIEEIDKCRKVIIKHLDELEKKMKDSAATLVDENNKKLYTTETSCDDIQKSLQASADTLKHLNTNKKADQLFTELKKIQQLIQDHDKMTSQLPTIKDVDEYIFEPNKVITQNLQDEKSLGTLSSKKWRQSAPSKNPKREEMKLSAYRHIKIKSSTDKNNCLITGIAVSPPNHIFVADNKNNSIKMINIRNGDIKVHKLQTESWDITVVNRYTLAVTLPTYEIIQFISFTSNSLTLKNQLKVDGACYGISHHQGKLAVTFTNPAKLQIMDLTGAKEISVEKDSHGDNIFGRPGYVTSNSDSIFVCDSGNAAVIWFNWHGEMMGRHEETGWLRGITLLDDGSFLVSNHKNDCLYRNGGDCKDKETILKDIEDPNAVCWCAETNTLYVSTENSLKITEYNNNITLYKMM